MADQKNETFISRGEPAEPQGPANAKERFYEKLRMPVRTLDIIIGVLIAAIVVVLVLGMMAGRA